MKLSFNEFKKFGPLFVFALWLYYEALGEKGRNFLSQYRVGGLSLPSFIFAALFIFIVTLTIPSFFANNKIDKAGVEGAVGYTESVLGLRQGEISAQTKNVGGKLLGQILKVAKPAIAKFSINAVATTGAEYPAQFYPPAQLLDYFQRDQIRLIGEGYTDGSVRGEMSDEPELTLTPLSRPRTKGVDHSAHFWKILLYIIIIFAFALAAGYFFFGFRVPDLGGISR